MAESPSEIQYVQPDQARRFDRRRIRAIERIGQAIQDPDDEFEFGGRRRALAILDALEVQIEDGEDTPEVNHLLVAALRRAIVEALDGGEQEAAIQAVESFEQQESERRERIRLGQPIPRTTIDIIDDLVADGYRLATEGSDLEACHQFEEAWSLFGRLHTSESRTIEQFSETHQPGEFLEEWVGEFLATLDRLADHDPRHVGRMRDILAEFDRRFPDEPEDPFDWARPLLEEVRGEKRHSLWSTLPEPEDVGRPVTVPRKPGRNEPCWCGSGKKYKLCHLPTDQKG